MIGPDRTNVIETSELEALLSRIADWTVDLAAFVDAHMHRSTRAKWAVLLSFDDGYRDIVEHALPLLERFQAPCVVFVTTGFVDGEVVPYEEEIADLVSTRRSVQLPGGRDLPAADTTARQRAYETIRKRLKPLTHGQREQELSELRVLNGAPPAARAGEFMTWDDIRALDQHPLVTVGAHGRYHTVLTAIAPRQAQQEIEHCQARFRAELGHTVDALAYPYGACSRAVEGIAAHAGFTNAFTTEPKGIFPRRSPLAIPRRHIECYLRG